MSTLAKTHVTPEEYLERERKAETKSEYYNGEIFAMSGSSRDHNAIATELYFLIALQLRERPCDWHTSDTRVLVDPAGLYTYPDLSVTCEGPRYADARAETLLNPTLIAEILSPSTESYDWGPKAKMYRDMPSLRELLLIAQDSYDVELYRRQDNGTWILFHAVGIEALVELASIDCTLSLRELYKKVVPV